MLTICLVTLISILLNYIGHIGEGDIGGYPIPYEKLVNTDTAFMIGDAYLMLYPSRVFFFYLSLYTTEMNLSLRDET